MIASTNYGGNDKHGGNGRAGPAPRESVPSERSMLEMRRILAGLGRALPAAAFAGGRGGAPSGTPGYGIDCASRRTKAAWA